MKHREHPSELRNGGFEGALERFGQEYARSCTRLVEGIRQRYPELARKGRRTGRALRNVCFFVWWSARDGDESLIPALFGASVLLSAQDDYYDNGRIPNAHKEAFRSAVDRFVRTAATPSLPGSSRQAEELLSLWAEVAKPIRSAAPSLQAFWKERACELNDAMAADDRATRIAAVGFDEYMHTATRSIGVAFIWSTYLVHKRLPLRTVRALDAVLPLGARVVRLSNDIASYRQNKNRRNAVTLLGGGRSAERRVKELIARDGREFRRRVAALGVGADVERVLLRSTEFLTTFYQRSDFDRRSIW